MANAQAARAAAVLISNSDESGFMRLQPDPIPSGGTSRTVTVPSASLPQNSALPLYAALASGQPLTVQFSTARLPSGVNLLSSQGRESNPRNHGKALNQI